MKSEQHEFPGVTELPLIVYRGVVKLGVTAPEACLSLFARNGWGGGWTDGIHPYHHFHATTHEALGIVKGRARVRFGGRSGPVVAVEAGDAVIIPAGVSHRNEDASDDLVVVGAYPGARRPDMERHGSDEITEAAPSGCGRYRCPRPIRCSARTGRSCGAGGAERPNRRSLRAA